jgi:hypothetical protein
VTPRVQGIEFRRFPVCLAQEPLGLCVLAEIHAAPVFSRSRAGPTEAGGQQIPGGEILRLKEPHGIRGLVAGEWSGTIVQVRLTDHHSIHRPRRPRDRVRESADPGCVPSVNRGLRITISHERRSTGHALAVTG